MARAKPSPPASIAGAPAAARALPAGVAIAVAISVAALAGPAGADDSDLCLLAAQDAYRLTGVPLSVLLAVTLTETGREGRPWPWTVNDGEQGHFFATSGEAAAFAESLLAAGDTSFDIGCFQLNWRWHGENFVSAAQMFDPLANASYAAGFLQDLHAEAGDWSGAAGAYHSRTPEHANRYRGTFDAHRATAMAAGADEGRLAGPLALGGTAVAAAAGPAAIPRANTFPLLQAPSGPPRLGSLVPLGG